MFRFLALAAVLISGLSIAEAMIASAEAAQCPAGQIYRVSLKICASRAGNMQYLPKRAGPTRVALNTQSRKMIPTPPRIERETGLGESEPTGLRQYAPQPAGEPPLNAVPASATPYGALTPFGALR